MDFTSGQAFTIQHIHAKWRGVTLKERSASQEHFLDVCRTEWAAYGWDDPEPASVPEDVILSPLLALNQARR